MDGWISLHRKLQNNPLWFSERFTRGQAWIDLLLLANNEDGYFYLRDHKINVKRGQVGWSILKLSERWGWSRSKTNKFINDLEKEQQVVQQQSHSTTIITIINYEKYQQKRATGRTTERQQKDTNNKDNKDNNILERQKQFEEEILTFENKYPIETLKAFYRYWSESDGKNMKKEKQETWETSKRLATWFNNDKKFKK